MDPLDPTTLTLGLVATTILFLLIAFFTRATPRRLAAVLVGSLPIIPLVMLYDTIAARLGWWQYPAVEGGPAPFAWYLAAAVFYGATLGLVGWRVIRRYGRSGLFGFLITFAVFGVARDYAYSRTTHLIVFGRGLVPLIADLVAYTSAALLVQLVMYWVAGPPAADRLARQARASTNRRA
jgi:hypothetical protein